MSACRVASRAMRFWLPSESVCMYCIMYVCIDCVNPLFDRYADTQIAEEEEEEKEEEEEEEEEKYDGPHASRRRLECRHVVDVGSQS